MSLEDRIAASRARGERILFEDPGFPHPDRLAGRKLQPPAGTSPSSTNVRAAPMLGSIAVTTVAGTDIYTPFNTFPVGTTIAGPYEAGFDAFIDAMLGWLGCSPSSRGYLAGGINTQTALEMVAYQCGVTLPSISGGVYKSLFWSMGVHSPPNTAGCTSPPGGLPGYAACANPAYHFHQYFTQLYNGTRPGHSTQIGITSPVSGSGVTPRYIYGAYESTGVLPTLDACNGHFGTNPDSPSVAVYHHHVTDKPPFAVGCFGPNADNTLVTLEQCRAFYTGESSITELAKVLAAAVLAIGLEACISVFMKRALRSSHRYATSYPATQAAMACTPP